ncbi:MAG: hypothetical protein EOQ32_31900 [Mesorhizobium sp.]|nr:MAG: hypothetical protein EOQ32_31900 [Mesorhizobium sp.]
MSHVSLVTGPERRRRWREEDQCRILAAAFAPGVTVVAVARQYDVRSIASIRAKVAIARSASSSPPASACARHRAVTELRPTLPRSRSPDDPAAFARSINAGFSVQLLLAARARAPLQDLRPPRRRLARRPDRPLHVRMSWDENSMFIGPLQGALAHPLVIITAIHITSADLGMKVGRIGLTVRSFG